MKENCKLTEKLNQLQPIGVLLLRVAVGVVMIYHGWGKLNNKDGFMGFLGGQLHFTWPSVSFHYYMAIACELGGGLGLLFGCFTRLAAFGVANAMAVAVFLVHFKNGLSGDNNGFEYPMILLAAALFFITNGAGPISIDAICCRKKTACCDHGDDAHHADHSEM